MSRKKKTTVLLKPLQYSHAAECWIQACQEGTRALGEILSALDEQQGPDWIHSHRRMRVAVRHFRRANFWAREGLKNPLSEEKEKSRREGRAP